MGTELQREAPFGRYEVIVVSMRPFSSKAEALGEGVKLYVGIGEHVTPMMVMPSAYTFGLQAMFSAVHAWRSPLHELIDIDRHG